MAASYLSSFTCSGLQEPPTPKKGEIHAGFIRTHLDSGDADDWELFLDPDSIRTVAGILFDEFDRKEQERKKAAARKLVSESENPCEWLSPLPEPKKSRTRLSMDEDPFTDPFDVDLKDKRVTSPDWHPSWAMQKTQEVINGLVQRSANSI